LPLQELLVSPQLLASHAIPVVRLQHSIIFRDHAV